MKTKQELQDDVKKYTRRKWLSVALGGAGGVVMLDSFFYDEVKKPEVYEEYEDINQALGAFDSNNVNPHALYSKTKPVQIYETPETKEYLNGLEKQNSIRERAIKGLEKNLAKIEKDPEFIKYSKYLDGVNKNMKKCFAGFFVGLIGYLSRNIYTDKTKDYKNQLKKVEENQK